ncbi:trafficking protein particle complex subunit 13 [Pectinophora gossypiella]|uniref:trafficking protein particle complex subunit 13 n=1 Tax=Pectinophora gossypiella TaxID=13191 RepID=UPI00214E8764|nr:trafficking protein particle complex subunit 13 [Pectinophora gossypiella]
MDPKDVVEHLVALKVMRLTKPALISPKIVTCDSKDLPGNILNNYLKDDATAVTQMETLAAGQFLLLPQSFGNIYLGETFSCYVCVHNETNQPVQSVSIKADLQTNSQRIPLSTQQNQSPIMLDVDETLSDVIHHEVKDLGTHILVCEVTYMSNYNTLASFRKFFKFEVMKPLDVKTKFYNAESDDVYLEAQVQNITSGSITLEQVSLESSQQFTVKSLNEINDNVSVFGDVTLLQPQESCQYLYCLSPRESISKEIKLLAAAKNIGKLDIVWRSNLGEKGRLQTSQLQRMTPDYGDIRLTYERLPSKASVDEPFDFKCKIVNASERTLDLILKLRSLQDSSLLWCGISNRKLGPLEPGNSIYVNLTALPISTGLHNITGVSLVDLFLKRTYDYDDLASIYVC